MKSKYVIVSLFAGALWIVLALIACTPEDQRIIETELARGASTAVVMAQTQAADAVQTGIIVAQTQAADVIKTGAAGAQTQAAPLQTKVAQAAQTALAEQMHHAETQAASIQQTAVAELTRLAPAPGGATIHYFALGDSIASGHGLMDDGTPCHRSHLGYPYKVAELLKPHFQEIRYTILACSGATAGYPVLDEKCDCFNKNCACRFKWLRNQVDEMLTQMPDDRPVLVTINIGANDFGWTEVGNLLPHIRDNADEYLPWVNGVSEGVARELRQDILPRLLEHPNVYVVITDLYNPFNRSSKLLSVPLLGLQPCDKLIGQLDCYERTEYGVQSLNNALVLDVFVLLGRPSRLRVTNVNPKFYGHESPQPQCGGSAPDVPETWIQYPGQPGVNGRVLDFMRDYITHEEFGDCFHPNEKGAQTYAEAVMEQFLRMRR